MPEGTHLVRASFFYLSIYILTTIIFAIVSTVASFLEIPTWWTLLVSLLISCIFLIGAYTRYFYKFSFHGITKSEERHYYPREAQILMKTIALQMDLLKELEEERAMYGVFAPSELKIRIDDLRQEIEQNKTKLEQSVGTGRAQTDK